MFDLSVKIKHRSEVSRAVDFVKRIVMPYHHRPLGVHTPGLHGTAGEHTVFLHSGRYAVGVEREEITLYAVLSEQVEIIFMHAEEAYTGVCHT